MHLLGRTNLARIAAAALAILAGCSGGGSPVAPGAVHSGAVSLVPDRFRPPFAPALRGRAAPAAAKAGLYAAAFYAADIWGFRLPNPKDRKAICTVRNVGSVNDVAVDGKGNLIDPDGASHSILIFKGPAMCGKLAGSIADPYGQPSDASSPDALGGPIAVANIFDGASSVPGSISICSVARGCTRNLTNPGMFEVAGVAMDSKGNCWADATNPRGAATLTYFQNCAGRGEAATGFGNSSFGGLDFDAHGNLVTIDFAASSVRVYSGCDPACKKVGGPLALRGRAVFGKLNRRGVSFAAADVTNGQIDVYGYTPARLTYKYSFNDGLPGTQDVEGIAYDPRSVSPR